MKKYTYYFWRYIFIFLSYLLLFLLQSYALRQSGGNALAVIPRSLGGVDLFEHPDFSSLLFYTTPILITIYLFSDYMRNDLLISYTYVFPRYGKKCHWLRVISSRLFVELLILYALLELSAIVIALICGLRWDNVNMEHVLFLLTTLLLTLLGMFAAVFIQNVLSLRFGSSTTYLLIAITYCASLYLPVFLPGYSSIWRFLIPVNQMYILHSDRVSAVGDVKLFASAIERFPIWFSIGFLLVLIVVIYEIAKILFMKSDVSNFVREVE